jgi:hypothetical protein
MRGRTTYLYFQIDTNRITARGGLANMNRLERWRHDGVIGLLMAEVPPRRRRLPEAFHGDPGKLGSKPVSPGTAGTNPSIYVHVKTRIYGLPGSSRCLHHNSIDHLTSRCPGT